MELESYQPDGEGEWRNEEEKSTVQRMRAYIERENPAAKVVDDATLRRFLRARSLNFEKGCGMFLKYFKWRQTAVPNGFISVSEITSELAQEKLFSQGYDRKGHPIGVCLLGRHSHCKGDLTEFRRLVIYTLDKFCSRMPIGKEKFTVIADIKGWCYSNCDIRAYLAALEIMQNYYPERLNKVFLIHVPYLFMKAWKIIYRFIDDNSKKKFIIVEDRKIKETLHEAIDDNQLPDIFGGKLPLVPVENS